MYHSLLYQLLTAMPRLQDDFLLLNSAMEQHGPPGAEFWRVEFLKHLLTMAVEKLGGQKLMCFIDALDECEENQVRDMLECLEQLESSAVENGISFHVYLSSRHYPHISIEKGIYLVIEDQEGHGQDIEKHVNSKLRPGKGKRMEQVKAEILERASRVFLWVVLVVQLLNEAYDHRQIYALRKRLKELPNDLDHLFADILTRDNKNKDELVLCLQWILYARKPLTGPELYFATISGIDPSELGPWDPNEITIEDIEKFVLGCSKGLAEFTRTKNRAIQFIHESVRDFLLSRNGLEKLQSEKGSNIAGRSHQSLKDCCHKYLEMAMSQLLHFGQPLDFDKPLPPASTYEASKLRKAACEKFSLIEYGVRNLFYHADAAQGYGISQETFLADQKETFPSCENCSDDVDVPPWFRHYVHLSNLVDHFEIRRYTSDVTMLYFMADTGL
jgi:hypothetical protein